MLCVLLSAGCARSPAAGAPLARLPGVPAQLNGWRMVSSGTMQGAPPTDTIYRFVDSTSQRISVIRYPVPPDIRALADTSQWVDVEGRKFERVQELLVQRGSLQSSRVAYMRTVPLQVGSRTVQEFAAAMVVRIRGKSFVDLEYLYLVGDTFLKIRATVPEESERKDIPAFARDLVRRFVTPPTQSGS